jgi:hypothetical protein
LKCHPGGNEEVMIRSLGALLRRFTGRSTASRSARQARTTRLEVEALEPRALMTVSDHGGALLTHVEVQALYYGPNWASSPYAQQQSYLDGFLQTIVDSSYMDMLTNAGYGVGRGSFTPGAVDSATIDKSQYLNDSQIQTELQTDIDNGLLQAPDSNRLYVVYVEDNVAVQHSVQDGGIVVVENSLSGFRGYHAAFTGTNANHQPATIHYAVVAYPGGSISFANNQPNLSVSFLSTLGEMTLVTSHELAEAVTDPDINKGWYDSSLNGDGEIGDIARAQTVYLKDYTVQRIADQNDQPMTPAGATAASQVSFVLESNGKLYEIGSDGAKLLASNVISISDQGIDNEGQAMIDVIRKDFKVIAGKKLTVINAYEYHDTIGWVFLQSGVASAVAGQGVSYVLDKGGTLREYHDPIPQATGSWTTISPGVASISAGTDTEGVNAVDVLWGTPGQVSSHMAYQYSDSSGWYMLADHVVSVSAGQQGIVAYVTTTGDAYALDQATNSLILLSANAAEVTAGTDAQGHYLIDLVNTSGGLYEYRQGGVGKYLGGNVQAIGKAHAGLVAAVFSDGDARAYDIYRHGGTGWHDLMSGAYEAV